MSFYFAGESNSASPKFVSWIWEATRRRGNERGKRMIRRRKAQERKGREGLQEKPPVNFCCDLVLCREHSVELKMNSYSRRRRHWWWPGEQSVTQWHISDIDHDTTSTGRRSAGDSQRRTARRETDVDVSSESHRRPRRCPLPSYRSTYLLTKRLTSGVTRVGDTRGGNWGCHPSIFSLKTWRPFFNRQFCGVTPWLFWLPFFAHRFIAFYCFHSGVSGVTPSRVSPYTFFTCPTSFLRYSL